MKIVFVCAIICLLVSCQSNFNKKHDLESQAGESCLICHSGLKGFSQYHNPQVIGCSSCHLGNIYSMQKEIAHRNMVKIPGNLSNAGKTCSTSSCHKGELSRVEKSLMTTNSGIVSIDRFAFGEIAGSDKFFHIEDIRNSASDRHIKNLCYKCHLGYEKKHYSPVSQLSRGGGCLACHLQYKHDGVPDIKDNVHPSLNLNVDNTKCFGCHSRSGRISTNYEGWYEIILEKEDAEKEYGYRILEDGRVFAKATEDIHHKAGLSCIDCHTSQEIMGDGNIYKHENQAVKIQCVDCHPKKKFNNIALKDCDSISVLDYALRGYEKGNGIFLKTLKNNIPLVNTGVVDSLEAFLTGKLNGEEYLMKVIGEKKCLKDKVHSTLDCNMCHTSWAPSCLGCHTAYDPDIQLKGGRKGKWYELVDGFGIAKPVMGLERSNLGYKIIPVIPGMIMTLDKSKFQKVKKGKDSIFIRWFAPVSAHTTTKEVRTCSSCHNDPQALGYGGGEIIFEKKNKKLIWYFKPEFENSSQDGLPMDAWIGYLKQPYKNKRYSGHSNVSPLNLRLQQRILRAGACITCHKDNIFRERMIKDNYSEMIKSCTEIKDFGL